LRRRCRCHRRRRRHRPAFPAEIRAVDSAYEFDFRLDSAHAPITEHTLLTEVQDRLLRLVDVLGLRAGPNTMRNASASRGKAGAHQQSESRRATSW
jgi:hypothetical protein